MGFVLGVVFEGVLLFELFCFGMHARNGDWDSVVSRIREVVGECDGVSDEYEVVSVFVTGSLAYGGGVVGKSDVDVVLGDNRDEVGVSFEEIGEVVEALRSVEDELCELVGLSVTGFHIVEVTGVGSASNRAMELQHQGAELAEKYGVDDSTEMVIYDVFGGEVLDDVRGVSY